MNFYDKWCLENLYKMASLLDLKNVGYASIYHVLVDRGVPLRERLYFRRRVALELNTFPMGQNTALQSRNCIFFLLYSYYIISIS